MEESEDAAMHSMQKNVETLLETKTSFLQCERNKFRERISFSTRFHIDWICFSFSCILIVADFSL